MRGLFDRTIPFAGGVTVSTCLVNVEERAEVPNLVKFLVANTDLALAA